jgi:hypothetical protein
VDGSDSDDFEGSLPPLLDGSDLDEQDLGDRRFGLDAARLIHYPDDIVAYCHGAQARWYRDSYDG